MSLLAKIRAALRRPGYRPDAIPAVPTAPVPPGRFAFVTSCFDTPPEFVRELAGSIRAQTSRGATWVLLDNGSTKAATRACLDVLGSEPNVHFVRVKENRGILGGMRACLEAANADFVLPVDADDLVAPDAIASFAAALAADAGARFLFSDEDHLKAGRRCDPFFRTGWDPALALASSYVWHLCCFDRRAALQLGVYADAGANFCHDWDTLLRFVRAGHAPAHVPRVLYTWRTHTASTTNNTADANQGSLQSQRHVLDQHLRACSLQDRFAVEDCPLWRGAPELRLRRLPSALPAVDLCVLATAATTVASVAAVAATTAAPLRRRLVVADSSMSPPPGFERLPTVGEALATLARDPAFAVLLREAEVEVPEPDWAAELIGWLELVADAEVVGARVLQGGRVVSAGDHWRGGVLASPDPGRAPLDPGYLAMALKPRCAAAVSVACGAVRGAHLAALQLELADAALLMPQLGAWLGAAAAARAQRSICTPFASAVLPAQRVPTDRLPGATPAFAALARRSRLPAYSEPGVWYGAAPQA